MTPADMIAKFILLRNKVNAIKDEHTQELLPYVTVMGQIENELLKHLEVTKLDSVNGPAGTAYKQVATSVTVSEWETTLKYIRDHELWDLLEARVAKKATLERIEESKTAVPGVKISQAVVLRVRAG